MSDSDRRLTQAFCPTSASTLQAAAAIFGSMIINNDVRFGLWDIPPADRNKQKFRDKI